MSGDAKGNDGRRRFGAFARHALPAIALSLAGVSCDGVGSGGVGSGGGAETDAAADTVAADVYAGLESVLIAALDERTDGRGEAVRPDAPTWPEDLRLHPEARVESIELMALLEDEGGRAYSFNRRFDRISLGAGEPERGSDDAAGFAFDDVVLLSGETLAAPAPDASSAGELLRSRTLVERVALGLATADERRMAVRDARLERVGGIGDGPAESDCEHGWQLVEGDGLALRYLADACPSGALLGGLALATSAPFEVDGSLRAGAERRTISGRGWVRRAWGEVPAPGGAVVFDRMVLDLEGAGMIEVTRSKRRSGRGPRTVTARLRDGSAQTEIAAEWTDAAEPGGGSSGEAIDGTDGTGVVPSSWRLEAGSLGVDVTLVPPAGGRLRRDATGRAWRGAVRARGSHRGVGFVEFVPIGAAPSIAEGRS